MREKVSIFLHFPATHHMFGLLQTSVATSELIFIQLVGSFKSFKDITHSHPILSFDNVQSVQV